MMLTLSAAAALLLAVEPAADASLDAELDALAEAWRSGAISEAARHAVSALAMIEDSSCPLRADAAIAAAIGGLANSARETLGSPGYLFWVAHAVDARLGVLPTEIAETVEALRDTPGADVRQDRHFLHSAYRRVDELEPGCAPARLDPELFTVEPDAPEAVIAAIEWPRHGDSMAWTRAELLFAYPRIEGLQLMERLGAMEGRVRPYATHRVLVFEPCETFSNADLGVVRLCREDPAP